MVLSLTTLIKNGKKVFLTEEDAVKSFGLKALLLTHADARERGAFVRKINIKVKEKNSNDIKKIFAYTHGKIFCGGHRNVIFGFIVRYIFLLFNFRKVSFAHTHPYCTGHKPDSFSSADELVARLIGIKYMYLVSPNGRVYRYDGKDEKRKKNGELDLFPIFDDLPKLKNKCDCINGILPKKISKKNSKELLLNRSEEKEVVSV